MRSAKGSARTPLGPKLPKIVATFVCAISQGQRTHSARTNYNIKHLKDCWNVEPLILCQALSSKHAVATTAAHWDFSPCLHGEGEGGNMGGGDGLDESWSEWPCCPDGTSGIWKIDVLLFNVIFLKGGLRGAWLDGNPTTSKYLYDKVQYQDGWRNELWFRNTGWMPMEIEIQISGTRHKNKKNHFRSLSHISSKL